MGVIILLALIVVIFIFKLFFVDTKHKSTSNSFSQAGVTVNFDNKTVTLKGRNFDIGDITSISREYNDKGHRNGGVVYIEVSDFKKPIYIFQFLTRGAVNKFYSRVGLALEKAGWKSS